MPTDWPPQKVVAGSDEEFQLTLLDPDDDPLTVFTDSDTLAVQVWNATDTAQLSMPGSSVTWIDADLGTVRFIVAGADTTSLTPGDYAFLLTVVANGLTKTKRIGSLRVVSKSGFGTSEATYLTFDEVLNAYPSLENRVDINFLINVVATTIEKYCQRVFPSATITETLDGPGYPALVLARAPITTIEDDAVTVNGTNLDNATGTEWTADNNPAILHRGDGQGDPRFGPTWSIGRQNITVVYTGGFTSIPQPVKQAALILLKHIVDASTHTGVFRREKIGDYEYELSPMPTLRGIPTVVEALLSPYVRSVYR